MLVRKSLQSIRQAERSSLGSKSQVFLNITITVIDNVLNLYCQACKGHLGQTIRGTIILSLLTYFYPINLKKIHVTKVQIHYVPLKVHNMQLHFEGYKCTSPVPHRFCYVNGEHSHQMTNPNLTLKLTLEQSSNPQIIL